MSYDHSSSSLSGRTFRDVVSARLTRRDALKG